MRLRLRIGLDELPAIRDTCARGGPPRVSCAWLVAYDGPLEPGHRENLDALLAVPGRPRSARIRVPGGRVAAVRTSDGTVYLGLTPPNLPATWISPRPTS